MKQLLILSGKGGTGKTTVASAFIEFAKAKAFADCDVDAPNLHLVTTSNMEPQLDDYYGMDKAVINEKACNSCGLCAAHCRFNAIELIGDSYEINYYACEGCGLCEQICPTQAITLRTNIAGELQLYQNDLVFSTARLNIGNGNSGKLVSEVKKQLVDTVASDVDLAIIDGSPGIGCPVIASLSGVDLVLLVAEPSLSGLSDLERIIETAEIFRVRTAVCVNKYDINEENTAKIKKLCEQREIAFVGKIPFDSNAIEAVNNGKSIAEYECTARDSIKEVFSRIIEFLFELE